jgi:hypothetical protein
MVMHAAIDALKVVCHICLHLRGRGSVAFEVLAELAAELGAIGFRIKERVAAAVGVEFALQVDRHWL